MELNTENTWAAWANKVLGDIERIESKQDEMTSKLNRLCVDLEILKTKAAMVGALWGAGVAVIVSFLLDIIIKGIMK